MRKRLGILISTGLLGIAVVAASQTKTSHPTSKAGTTTTDLSGNWVLDRSRSDAPPSRGGGPGRWGGGTGAPDGMSAPHGNGGHRGAHPDSGRGAGSGRPPRLPQHFHATQTASLVSFEDSTGAVVQEIATIPAAADTLARAPGAAHWLGAWQGSKLIVSHAGPRGSQLTETWSLEDKGASLVSVVRIEGGDMPERTFKRVYRRAGGEQ